MHTDRIGSPFLVNNKLKVAQWTASYQPYGKTQTTTNPGSIIQNVRLPGMQQDAEFSNIHNGFRDYLNGTVANNPMVGYTQADPIGLAGGLNPYRYANDNPLIYVDPDGQNALTSTLGRANPVTSIAQSTGYIIKNIGPAMAALPSINACLMDPTCSGNLSDNLGGAIEDVFCPDWLSDILFRSKGGKQYVAHPHVQSMAKDMKGDYCSNLKKIMNEARRSGDSNLFKAARATFKQDCRGYRE